jgi:molybdopterin converting factor small subunit
LLGGDGTIDLDLLAPTVQTVLDRLAEQCGQDFRHLLLNPETGRLSPDNPVLENGRYYRYLPQSLDNTLRESDLVAIFPPVAGG